MERNSLVIAIGFTVLIAYLSLANLKLTIPELSFSNLDKVEHFFAYFVLAFSWFIANKNDKFLSRAKIFICLIVYGALLEVLQATLTSYRVGDVLDILANSFGILIAYLFFDRIYAKIVDILWG